MSTTTPVNSHDVGEAHGLPWIMTYTTRGSYDVASAADGRNAAWLVHAPPGKAFRLEGKEDCPLRQFRKQSPADAQRSTYKPFVTFEDAAAWCERTYGITGWKRDKFGSYHPDPTANDVPCSVSVSRSEGISSSHTHCDRKRKPGEEKCGVHLNADRRRAEADAAYRENSTRSDANKRSAEDVCAELAEFGIEGARPHYDGTKSFSKSGYTGNVTVDGEKLKGLLTQLKMAREMLGDDMPGSGAW